MEKLLKLISNFATRSNRNVFLVGGFLRDLLLGRETKDFDLVPEGNAEKFASNFAREAGGSFVLLDEKNKVYRVVKQRISKKKGKEIFNLDFSQMRGEKIEDDLLLRDFTINAMAVRLDIVEEKLRTFTGVKLSRESIIDPCGGMVDLRKKLIRKISPRIFNDDPLRLLRGYRLAVTLGFSIEKETENEVRRKVDLIKRVARERIRDELFKILSIPQSYRYIRRLNRVGLLSRIIPEMEMMKERPENYYHREGLWGHSLETLRSVEEILESLTKLFPRMSGKILTHLEEKVYGGIERKTLLKWAAIFHDIGKPKTVRREKGRVRFFGHEEAGTSLVIEIMERLKFSNKAIKIVDRMIESHMRPGNLSEAPRLTDRAIHRFFRDLSEEGVDTLLLSLADRYSYFKTGLDLNKEPALEINRKSIKRHEKTVRKMLSKYYYHKERILPKPLVRGDEVIERFNLPQGPVIGKLLKRLEEAQAGGKLKNREEALQFLKKILEKEKL
jgi:poly(A) polymerase